MKDTDQIIAEAAIKCAALFPMSFGIRDRDFEPIIKAAIEKATETLRQDIRGLQEARWQEHRERESRAAHASGSVKDWTVRMGDEQGRPAHTGEKQ